ncbi:hypothetical protein BDZ97DRAFT_1839806 [Flammula alnicola]|nr:hypothetical protein BDZ97DRAFT_1839806 [Flammula alnicola]
MPVRCIHCGASTIWDDSVGSAVCTSCGSLADPSQSVLTSSQYGNQNDTTEPSLWDSSASTTLKSLRKGNNWDLAGQGKESRDRKNAYATAEFIKSLAVSLNATGLSPRAITLFNQVKSASHFRWGQKSRSVAAACLAIALRESNRPDSIRDIASILKVQPASVSREFMSITSTLKLSLTLIDPSVHISTLQNHLVSALKDQQQSGLPASLVKFLQALCLRSAAKTATSLCQVLARLSPGHDVLRLPVPPTACGIFILALEAENRAALNPLGDLAQCLGSRCHAAKSVVMARYKTVQDEIASWIERVPWLDKYETKNGRAKVSKRLVVARGLKDVIQFQEEIWQQQTKPSLELELNDDESKADEEDESTQSLGIAPPPHKRPKLNHALTQATRFLLDPLGGSISSMLSVPSKSNQTTLPSDYPPSRLPLAMYILTNSSFSLSRRPPTRLQLLALDRGGVDEEHIPDEELFSEGEFEKLLRGEDEIQILRQTFGWKEGQDDNDNADKASTSKPSRKARNKRTIDNVNIDANAEEEILSGSALRPRKKSRLNMEALAQFLASDDDRNEHSGEDGIDISMMGLEEVVDPSDIDEDVNYDNSRMYDYNEDQGDASIIVETSPSPHRHPQTNVRDTRRDDDADEEVVLDNWRPPTPEPSGGLDSRYEEERPP